MQFIHIGKHEMERVRVAARRHSVFVYAQWQERLAMSITLHLRISDRDADAWLVSAFDIQHTLKGKREVGQK